jgi:ubiquinone/menaquinone biosynthesis C-methylase UbiE
MASESINPDAPGAGQRESARRAEALYDDSYARNYRDRDEELLQEATYQDFISWLQEICNRFHPPIDVLDLGCGTGRYFWGVHKARTLVGLDASAAMLSEARRPVRADQISAGSISLVQGDLVSHEFADQSFDLVYSIGVLAEHVPLDALLVSRVWRWLKPGGRFAFTTVDPRSADVPQTWQRRMAALALPLLPGPLGKALHRRLMVGGMYGDERWIRGVLSECFVIESVDQFQSDVHLHGRCVARKRVA